MGAHGRCGMPCRLEGRDYARARLLHGAAATTTNDSAGLKPGRSIRLRRAPYPSTRQTMSLSSHERPSSR